MNPRLWFAILILLVGGTGPVSAQDETQCFGALCVTSQTRGTVTTLIARNTERAAPITVTLGLRLTNLTARGRSSVVLGPGARAAMITLTPARAGPWTFQYDYAWVPGDARARPDPRAVYALPYRNAALPVIQGCGGWFSHRGDAAQAVDFAMPVGTLVRAARAGRVIFVKMDSTRGGRSRRYLNDDNKVLIQHADGTVATYSHLSADSARVRLGQSVQVGDPLALSGNTGFSAQPHLHFEVYAPRFGGGRQSWPVAWNVGGERVICPRRGRVLRN